MSGFYTYCKLVSQVLEVAAQLLTVAAVTEAVVVVVAVAVALAAVAVAWTFDLLATAAAQQLSAKPRLLLRQDSSLASVLRCNAHTCLPCHMHCN